MSRAACPVAPARLMVSLHQPSDAAIQAFLDHQRSRPARPMRLACTQEAGREKACTSKENSL